MSAQTNNPIQPPGPIPADLFERLFNGAGLPIFVCDLDGLVQHANPLALELLPASPGTPLRNLLPPEAQAAFDDRFSTLLRDEEASEFRVEMATLDGVRELTSWLTPLDDGQGVLKQVVVWFQDISNRGEIRRSVKQRERLTSLGVLSGAVAHHYNNLLCCIATSLEFSLNMNTLTATRRALQRTTQAVQRANELTQQLLAFAQGDFRAEHQADLTETLLFYFDENEARLAERGVQLEVVWEHVPVRAIPREQMMRVLGNLTNNALEAMSEGGRLHVSLSLRDENHIAIAIADTGDGIDGTHLDQVFEPFFTTKGVLGEGTNRQVGMGLAVAHGLVSEMHGTITATNLPQGGARFEILLPVHVH